MYYWLAGLVPQAKAYYDSAVQAALHYYTLASVLYVENALYVGAVACVGVVGLLIYVRWVLNRRAHRYDKWRGAAMATKREREEAMKQIIADVITDAFEDLEYRGIITRDETNRWYRKFSYVCTLPDLVPAKVRATVETIKTRRARAHGSATKPIPIPDGPPAPEVSLSQMMRRPLARA